MRKLAACCVVACLSACGAVTPPPDTARLPPNAFGTYADGDIGAINASSWAFADPARTRNNPADAARAIAAVDYLAGELSTSPRWDFMSPLTKMQMLQARTEVRSAAGIAPNAPSQDVVDQLLYASDALAAGNPQGAMAAMTPPTFTLPPGDTLARLASLPYLQEANVASMHAAMQSQPDSGGNFDR
ncbi:MAG: hypothetical protein JOZ42_13735 [Acetobacteraceae bacterium]|nr:hypothetical protein [Acetobacteraceae bacterium]